MDKVAELHKIMELLQDYWDKYNNGHAVVWVKNDETGQTFAYTRGEHSADIIDLIKNLGNKEASNELNIRRIEKG